MIIKEKSLLAKAFFFYNHAVDFTGHELLV